MAGGVIAGVVLLDLVRDVVSAGPAASGISAGDASVPLFRKDCTDLVRRIALLAHLLEEIRDFGEGHSRLLDASASSSSSTSSDLVVALRAAKRLLLLAGNFHSNSSSVSFIFLLKCSFFFLFCSFNLFGCWESW
jgi:hypothetical protein